MSPADRDKARTLRSVKRAKAARDVAAENLVRAVVAAFESGTITYPEIAEVLGVSRQAVRQMVAREVARR